MPYITYWRKSELRQDQGYRQVTYFPFPVNARGFLYFWQHPTFPIASGVRFRVAQEPNVPGFIQGRDLQTPYGTPWHIPLLALVASPRYAALRDVLQQDGYIPPQLSEYCAQLKRSDILGQWSQLVFLRGQPFHLDLGVPHSKIFLVGMNGIRGIRLDEDLFCQTPYPFKCTFHLTGALCGHGADARAPAGVVTCQFETRPNYVAIRVIRAIEPVQFIDGYEGITDKLQPGQLVTLRGQPQLFLSQKDKKGVELNKRWQYISKKHTFAWSWHE